MIIGALVDEVHLLADQVLLGGVSALIAVIGMVLICLGVAPG
ncbi:hypothetical protein AB0M43_37620 [Longispora sp. NPDC051575]